MRTQSGLALALAVGTSTFLTPPNDTTMFRGGPSHLGVYESRSAPTLSRVLWKFKTLREVASSPAYADGTVYVGSADHNLYALEARDGTLRWKFETKGSVASSPAVDNGRVFVGSVDGNFYAVDAQTGTRLWSFATRGERRFTAPGIHGAMPRTEMMADPFDVFLSSPTVSGDIVYFGSGDHNVYALDTKTGQVKWTFTTGNVVHASPAVVNGVVYIGSWDRNLYALDARTGAELWRFQTGQDTVIYNQVGIASSAAVANGIVFFGCRDGHFYAVDARSGKLRWSHDNHMGWVIASPAVLGDKVYFPTSDGTRFKALDTATGSIVFNTANKAVSFSSPAIVGGFAFFGTSDGWVHKLDLVSGKVTAEFQTDGNRENSAKYIGADGKIKDNVYPDFTLDGMILGQNRLYSLGAVLSSPIAVDGVLYFGSMDGNVYAVN
jgi:outer membrane protein assembly factor BamB